VLISICLSIASAILLALAYLGFGLAFLAWFALIPLFSAINRAKNCREASLCGLTMGFVFSSSSVYGLLNANIFLWLLVSFVGAVFFMLFAGAAYIGVKNRENLYFKTFWLSLSWVVFEFLRSEMFIAKLGWNLLAYSQSAYLPIIQISNILGSYGLGFLIALVNALLFYVWIARKNSKRVLVLVLIAIIAPVALLSYGAWVLSKPAKAETNVRISVIQPNIPQSIKWMHTHRAEILRIHKELTRRAAIQKPDLIVWPEASFPGYFNTDIHAKEVCDLAKELKTPLLIGAPYWVDKKEVYNSAYLIDENGVNTQHYNKIILVAFSEYTPLKFILGWFKPLAYTIAKHDFSAGKEKVVFRWSKHESPFAVLICFEDIFSNLARNFVARGANFFVVITNDAWFGESSMPYQHLQASIFRAVENGVSVVRAANTGISAFISCRGKVLASVENETGDNTFIAGQKTYDLPIVNENTLYRQGGYLFPYCAGFIFLSLGVVVLRQKSV
jgi:apolipoprotein N-acyltransferase